MKVYEYGALEPTHNLEVVEDQMHKANDYYNRLVKLENDRRAKVREITRTEEVAALEEVESELAEKIKKVKARISAKRKRDRSSDPGEGVKEELSELRAQEKSIYQAIEKARRKARKVPEIKAGLKEISTAHKEAKKKARKESDVYWGTYLTVEQQFEQAANTTSFRKDVGFRRYDGIRPGPNRERAVAGRGHLSVQLQGGLDTEVVMECTNRQIRIEPLGEPAREDGKYRRSEMRTVVWLRANTDGRSPVWTKIPIMLHRPLPPGKVKWAHLLRWREGLRTKWKVQFVVKEDDPIKHGELGDGVVAVDLGWRRLGDDEVRVAVARGKDGEVHECRLTAPLSTKLDHADSIQSIRDRELNDVRPLFEELAKGRDEAKHIHLWKSKARFRRFADEMGDKAPQELHDWAKQDRHLCEYESGDRQSFIRARKDMYRKWAVNLARNYDTLILEGDGEGNPMNLTKFAQRAPIEDEPKTSQDPRRRIMKQAAPNQLRSCLDKAFKSRGGRVAYIDSAHTTTICPYSGVVHDDVDFAASHLYQCPTCNQKHDQDVAAALVLLQRASADVLDEYGESLELTKDKGLSKRQRRFRGMPEASAT